MAVNYLKAVMCLKVVSISDVNLSSERRQSVATSDWNVLLLVLNNLRVTDSRCSVIIRPTVDRHGALKA
jgi:hypothetical protein